MKPFTNGEKPSAWDDIQIEYVKKLIDELGIKNFFETGTYKGNTSLYFWRRGLKVYTAEISKKFFNECVELFKGTNIEAVNVRSIQYLKQFLEKSIENTLFYLDAHWGDIPLKAELSELLKLDRFVIIVHDVQIPNQPQFSFDIDVSSSFLHTPLPEGTAIVFPKYHTQNKNWPSYLTGYFILSKGYSLIRDDRFTSDVIEGLYEVKIVDVYLKYERNVVRKLVILLMYRMHGIFKKLPSFLMGAMIFPWSKIVKKYVVSNVAI